MTVDTVDKELAAWLKTQDDGDAVLLGSGYQAVVKRYASPWGAIVVKSPHAGSSLAWLSRMAIRREAMIYDRLIDIPGIPRSFGLTRDGGLVLEHVAGPSLRAQQTALVERDRFFDRLLRTILAMHAAGVAHGDLKRKDNIIVGTDETPYLIDFGIARELVVDGGRINRYLFDVVRQMDLNAWVKLKYGRRPQAVSDDDAAIYRPLLIESLARWVRIPWQKITLRRARQRWRAGK